MSTQQTHEPNPYQADEPQPYYRPAQQDQSNLYNQSLQYQDGSHHRQTVTDTHVHPPALNSAAPVYQPVAAAAQASRVRGSAPTPPPGLNSAAPIYQPASAQADAASQSQSSAPAPAPEAASEVFDVDAWLLDMGVGSTCQQQAAPAVPAPAEVVNAGHYVHDAGQHGGASLSRPHSSGSDSSRVRYRPPHMRTDTESSSEVVLSSPKPFADSNGAAYASTARKPPPGFPALY